MMEAEEGQERIGTPAVVARVALGIGRAAVVATEPVAKNNFYFGGHKMNRRTVVVMFLPLLLLAVAGCKGVNVRVRSHLDYSWDQAMLPVYESLVIDSELTDAEKAALMTDADALTEAIAAEPVGVWGVDRRYLAAVEQAAIPVLADYQARLAASDKWTDSKKITLQRTIFEFFLTLRKGVRKDG